VDSTDRTALRAGTLLACNTRTRHWFGGHTRRPAPLPSYAFARELILPVDLFSVYLTPFCANFAADGRLTVLFCLPTKLPDADTGGTPMYCYTFSCLTGAAERLLQHSPWV